MKWVNENQDLANLIAAAVNRLDVMAYGYVEDEEYVIYAGSRHLAECIHSWYLLGEQHP